MQILLRFCVVLLLGAFSIMGCDRGPTTVDPAVEGDMDMEELEDTEPADELE